MIILIKVLSDSFVKSANKQIADAIAAIKEKHTVNGKAPSLRAEVPIVSKEVDGAFMDLIHQQTNLGTSWAIGDITDVVRLNGRADLIVIDDNGDVFVYDFKNTEYPLIIGSKTNASNEIKLASYSAMSTQWGLPVKGMGFVEFSIGYGPDKVTPTTFNFRKITPLGVNDNVNAANTYFPSGISESPVKDMNEIADIVVDEMKLKDVEYIYSGSDRGWKGDVPKFSYDITKILNTGWKPKYNSTEAVRKTVKDVLGE